MASNTLDSTSAVMLYYLPTLNLPYESMYLKKIINILKFPYPNSCYEVTLAITKIDDKDIK